MLVLIWMLSNLIPRWQAAKQSVGGGGVGGVFNYAGGFVVSAKKVMSEACVFLCTSFCSDVLCFRAK